MHVRDAVWVAMSGLGLAIVVTTMACGGDDRPPDGAADTGADSAPPLDAGSDADAEMDGGSADADAGGDGSADASMDGGADADAAMDAAVDATTDADTGPSDFDAMILASGGECPCSFCWSYPTPEGEDLHAAWGTGGRIWSGGAMGVLHYWDGTETRRAMRASSDIVAMTGVTLRDAYALTASDEVLHWDGATWTPISSAPMTSLVDVHARVANEVWVANDRNVARFDGTGWTMTSPPRVTDFRRVWAVGGDEAYAVGEYAIEHYQAGAWTRDASSVSGFRFRDVWASAPDDVWVAGGSLMRLYHYDGTAWSAVTTVGSGGQPDLVGGTGPNDIWAVSTITGDVVHYDGSSWTAGTLPNRLDVAALAVPTPGEPWLFGDSAHTARFVSGAWERVGSPTYAGVERMWASGADDVWVTGFETGPLHYDGTAWSVRDIGASASSYVPVFGLGPNDVWVASNVAGHHWDGTSWTSHTLLINFTGIWGAATDDVWFVAGGGRAAHWDGSALTEVLPRPSSSTLNGVYGFAADDIWAVGVDGVFRYDGSWATFTTPTSERLHSVWGSAPNDVWIGGQNGALYQWDGSTWTDRSISTSASVLSITGRSATDVWFVLLARPATVYHWDGATMTPDTCSDQGARAVTVAGADVWLGVGSGALRRAP